jgi:3-oxoacyl-[acyl-carrier-protein] synthase-3
MFSDGYRGDLIWMPSQVTHVPPPAFGVGAAAAGNAGHVAELARRGKYVQLNGREVFKFAVRCMVSVVQEALLSVPLPSLERVFLVPHQVNERIIDSALAELPIPRDRVVLNLERYGNTSAASVPIALDEAVRTGVVGPGDHMILVAFGGGMTWAGAVVSL